VEPIFDSHLGAASFWALFQSVSRLALLHSSNLLRYGVTGEMDFTGSQPAPEA